MKHTKPSRGFTLTELMVSITIGLVILAAVSTIFATTKRSYNEQDRQAKMQENARFALHFLMHDLRHAGYYGCLDEVNDDTVKNTVNGGGGMFLNALFPIEGLDGDTAATWYPSGDTASVPVTIRPNTDALVLRMALPSDAVSISSPMPNASAELKVSSVAGINPGDIVMLSDCASADVMQITAVQAASLHLQHNSGGSTSPGNSTQVLSKPYAPPAQVIKFTSRMYYLADNPNGVPSLFRKDNAALPVELVEGVEQMQVTYGKDTDTPPDDVPNIYLRAGQAGLQTAEEWARVRTVRLGLLVRTPSDKDQDQDIKSGSWEVNGFDVPNTDTNDSNRRRVFHVTVNMRNLP